MKSLNMTRPLTLLFMVLMVFIMSSCSSQTETNSVTAVGESAGEATFSESSVPSSSSSSESGSLSSSSDVATSSSSLSSVSSSSKKAVPASSAPATSSSSQAQNKPVSSLPSRIVAGYYTNYSAYSGFTPDKVNVSMLNVMYYAFADVDSNLKITAGDPSIDYANFSKLTALKKTNPNLKILISVGGWGGASDHFSDIALTDAKRKAFASSCAAFVKQYGFDGVDIDWEFPVSGGSPGRPEDKANFTLLMQALRQALNTQAAADGKYYYLTFAGGPSGTYISNVQLTALAQTVDLAVVMTYDLHGPWDTYTDLNAPLSMPAEASPQYKTSVESSVSAWLNAGFPASKLVMGVPFYGYNYSGAGSDNNGLYQHFSSAKAIGYDTVVSTYLSNGAYQKFTSSAGQVPYLFGNNTFISYDDVTSMTAKVNFAKARGLRGASAWELSYDKTSSLLGVLYNGLH